VILCRQACVDCAGADCVSGRGGAVQKRRKRRSHNYDRPSCACAILIAQFAPSGCELRSELCSAPDSRRLLHAALAKWPAVDCLRIVCGARQEIQELRLFFLQIDEKAHSSHGFFDVVWVTLSPVAPFTNNGCSCAKVCVPQRHLGTPHCLQFPVSANNHSLIEAKRRLALWTGMISGNGHQNSREPRPELGLAMSSTAALSLRTATIQHLEKVIQAAPA
jgi:hypothetical protein